MKAISLWQPYASLIAAGIKQFETRSWAPPKAMIGQTIAIHAAKKVDPNARAFVEELIFGQRAVSDDICDRLCKTWENTPAEMFAIFGDAVMPVGGVVCTAKLEAAFRLGSPINVNGVQYMTVVDRRTQVPSDRPEKMTILVDDYGDYSPGRWVWLLTNIKVFAPVIPLKGAQGFFDLPQGWMVP